MRGTGNRNTLASLVLLLAHAAGAAAALVQPGRDTDVAEVLAAPTVRVAAAMAAATPQDIGIVERQARSEIQLARQTGDSRYWGRAQAMLHRWWDREDAPPPLALLQATVHQGRHEFAAARRILEQLVARSPGHAQAWLNLAALDRLQARYATALRSCAAVEVAGAPLYGRACRLETISLQGRHTEAADGLRTLVRTGQDQDQRSWLMSLLAESLERAGQDAQAQIAYRDSLQAQSDLYTAIALSD
ncbi:MAG: hypothetical protein ABIR55_19020, partial [Burkholderiaceae bacterium]